MACVYKNVDAPGGKGSFFIGEARICGQSYPTGTKWKCVITSEVIGKEWLQVDYDDSQWKSVVTVSDPLLSAIYSLMEGEGVDRILSTVWLLVGMEH